MITPDQIAEVEELTEPPAVTPEEYVRPRRDRDRTQPKRDTEAGERITRDLGDFVASGHGYMVESFSTAMTLTTRCRYCNGPLPLPETADFICEFPHIPWDKCRCNWCVIKADKLLRNRGGQPEICNTEECRREQKREEMRRYRARQKAEKDAMAGITQSEVAVA
ncbi:hypothetical protein QM806_36545 [Rhodococcus sp. IEGM 1351]|uniref:hypothetical protein n=1 Tax=Rhodococcus sp. IEGM 1351 TaxID=3047089 RepID=UPI0024B6CAA4|nr:hypothetical protein [Rhodococcus sp. IEGM 1351]MDI9940872.1 hypothetical protein [Rhodococcus sp. IEGM 1351]